MGAGYDGERVGSKKHGYGRELFEFKFLGTSLLLTYVGFYKNDKKHGMGLLKSKNWSINGYWEDDLLVGYCTYEEKPTKDHEGLLYNGTMIQKKEDTKSFPWMKDGFGMYIMEIHGKAKSISSGFFTNEKKMLSCNIIRQYKQDIRFEVLRTDEKLGCKQDSCIASYNPDSLKWEIKSYIDGKESKLEEIKENSYALNSLFQDNPIKQVFKGKFKDVKTNLVIEKLDKMINDKFNFPDVFEAGGLKYAVLEILSYNDGIFHFVIAETSKMSIKFHAKGFLCRGRGNIELCAWEERIKKSDAMNGKLSKEALAPKFINSYIFALKYSYNNDSKKSSFFDLVEVKDKCISRDPKLFMEVEEYLNPGGFLNVLYRSPDFNIDYLERIYVLLLGKLAYLEEHGIFLGNLNPEHVWVGNYKDPNNIQIKLVGLSHSIILSNKGDIIDRNILLKTSMDILAFDSNILTEKMWKREEINQILPKAEVTLYMFDIKRKSSKYYTYLPYDAKIKIKQQSNLKNEKDITKMSLFQKESTAYAMSFFTSIMDFCIAHADDLKDYSKDSKKMMLELIEVTRRKASISQDSEKLAKGKQEFIVYILKMAQQILDVKLVRSSDNIKELIFTCAALVCQESLADTKKKQETILEEGNNNPTIYLKKKIQQVKCVNKPFNTFSSVRESLSSVYVYINM